MELIFPNFPDADEKLSTPPTAPEIVLAIPTGPPCHLWITTGQQPLCAPIAAIKNIATGKIRIHPLTATSYAHLKPGTLFRATTFAVENTTFACVEDILLFKGSNCNNKSFAEKWAIMAALLHDVALPVMPSPLHIGLPLAATSVDALATHIHASASYPIDRLRFRFSGKFRSRSSISTPWPAQQLAVKKTPKTATKPPHKTRERIFRARAMPQHDTYHLCDANTNEFVDVAIIPDIRTSTLMHAVFNKGRPHHVRLDALEESDDEATPPLEKESALVMCHPHPTLNRWIPIAEVT